MRKNKTGLTSSKELINPVFYCMNRLAPHEEPSNQPLMKAPHDKPSRKPLMKRAPQQVWLPKEGPWVRWSQGPSFVVVVFTKRYFISVPNGRSL